MSNVSDMVECNGKTIRQNNAEKNHSIPIGSLVEVNSGARLFVVFYGRDCDMTPLYYLSPYKDDTTPILTGFKNPSWIGGYSEDSLEVIHD